MDKCTICDDKKTVSIKGQKYTCPECTDIPIEGLADKIREKLKEKNGR